ncbi:uncharacterized protein E0L32_003878 [Thyridium curvatum]|uniref:Uncharacterized protein n=1 Tax=Thyridium curvatum TaxID=1093900 RepID=A0A507BD29_9PEZI|nr:uncharacterized protein E0L32_003878 [Thyridium curvatum]TPX16584.1 hypothetical protein E0L32_003878 [Thyridium curvatum]
MAPAVDSTAPFHRSQSTPDLLSSLTTPAPSLAGSRSDHRTLSLKSLPSLPAFDVPSFDLDNDFETTFLSSKAAQNLQVQEAPVSSPAAETGPALASTPEKPSRTMSVVDRRKSWLPGSRSSPNFRDLLAGEEHALREAGEPAESISLGRAYQAKALEKTRAVSGSFASFARRTWKSDSRSPSPRRRKDRDDSPGQQRRDRSASGGSPGPKGLFSRKRIGPLPDPGDESSRSTDSLTSSTGRALNRASVYLTKLKERPQSMLISRTFSSSPAVPENHSEPEKHDAPVLPALEALSDLANPPRNSSHTEESSGSSVDSGSGSTAPVASETGSQTTAETNPSHGASRDPLWTAFKDLEDGYATFASKTTTAQKVAVARTSLFFFLQQYALDTTHKVKKLLSTQDLERRTGIYDKWWNGLLDLLEGPINSVGGFTGNSASIQHMQPLAGVERPAILEALTMVMMRPEWRMCTTVFRPLTERSPAERVRPRSSSNDSGSFGAANLAFLAESAEHNIRNMFVANLLRQMIVVVDKMSLRHTPSSLVNFAGKACAYAFFFVPGIADVLVRLWALDRHPDSLRRMADAFGLPRRSKGESDDIIALFPPTVGPLGWTSVQAMTSRLRRPAKLPLQVAKIQWHGPWMSRWRGGDTDLFFVFCKYYFILADDFMPAELPLVEKARAPAFVLLHAHLLNILDSTIHRQAAVEAMMGPQMADAAHGADASLTTLPAMLPSNILRGMDENRMVLLLKDFLSLDEAVVGGAGHTFAESFMTVLGAVTKRISKYDHSASYLLCDFLQETLIAYDSYYGYTFPMPGAADAESKPVDYVDWTFWFGVCRMILDSNNTMSEIRLLTFLFGGWDIIAADPARKEELCINWLLSEEVFEKFFNNWCPMVRAYYMRLLCWRVCRDPGSANELDARIFLLVSERLGTVWSHYLWLKQNADNQGAMPPSTAPSLPQPGKRFMIIRTEVGVPQHGLLAGFDQTSCAMGRSAAISPREQQHFAGLGISDDGGGKDSENGGSYKKKWSLLGKALSFSSAKPSGGGTATSAKPTTYEEELEKARRDTAASRTRQPGQQVSSGAPLPPPKSAVSPVSDASSTGSSPVFDAAQFVFKFILHNVPWQGALRDRILTRPRLPAPAQARVSARGPGRGRSDSPPPPPPGLPPITRRHSGHMLTGLISGARNANPADSVSDDDGRSSLSSSSRASVGSRSVSDGSVSSSRGTTTSFGADVLGGGGGEDDEARRFSPLQPSPAIWDMDSEREARDRQQQQQVGSSVGVIRPVKPAGIYATSSRYAGRALAEWSLVVNECNSFIDRRRDEGVLGLSEVEVPTLGVENMRRLN